MLTVGFDDQIFQAQPRGGVSKYFVELMTRLPDYGIDPVVLSTRTRNLHLGESGLVPTQAAPGRMRSRAEWIAWRLVGRPRTTPPQLPRLDVMHHTFTHPAYLRSWHGPRVMTLFDMTPELFPEYFKFGNPHFAKRRYCAECDAIISISQTTADDMAGLYTPDLAAKTHVIHLGVGESFLERGAGFLDLPDRYLLFVGVRGGYKDFTTFWSAFERLAATDPALNLVVVGGGPFSETELSSVARSALGDRVRRIQPADAEIPEVYRRATAFVFPSLYEGFGLPTLEALASGTATVLADTPSSREVGGAVARYFHPGDVDDLTNVLRSTMTPDVLALTRTAGPAYARAFTWDLVAERSAEVYRSVARSSER
jgi:glycosyltransferase involved in cell wall biosynthesis